MNIEELMDENDRLKAELAHLRASSFVTAVPVEEYEKLKAEVERLHKYVETMERESMSDEYDINNQTRIINGLLTEKEQLKAEVERLTDLCKKLSAQHSDISCENIILRKAGDALVLKVPDIMAGCVRAEEAIGFMNEWIAAKEGKPSV